MKTNNYIENILGGILIVSLIILISLNLYVLVGAVVIFVLIFLFIVWILSELKGKLK